MRDSISFINHPITRPLYLITPGLVFLLGMGIYGFPSISWKLLACEIVAILVVSHKLRFSLALILGLMLFGALFFLGSEGSLTTRQLALFLIPSLLYHLTLLQKPSTGAHLKPAWRDLFFALGAVSLSMASFSILESNLMLKSNLFAAIFFGISVLWKVIVLRFGLRSYRLGGDVASECIFFTLSLGLGPLCFMTSFGVYLYQSFLWWPAFAALLVCLRLSIPKGL